MRTLLSRRVVLAAVALSAILATAASAQKADRPSIVFDRSIGDVHLGDSRDQVEYLYGDTNDGKLEILDNYFPRATKYAGRTLYRMTYRLHGGTLRVSYVDGRVKVVETTSSYYRTSGGTHVGSAIPLGPCHKNRYGGCDYRWHGFAYEPDCGKAWLRGSRRTQNVIYMHRGRVAAIQIGDPDVILYCF